MNIQKDYTIENAIAVVGKAMEAIKSETVNSCWRKPSPDGVWDFKRFTPEPIKEIMKDWIWKKKKKGMGEQVREVVVKGFKIWILEKFKS